MKLSRFTGATTQDALRQVKAVLGAEAVILDTQATRGGVVVTAAVDRDTGSVPAHDEMVAEMRALSALVRATVGRPLPTPLAALERSLLAQGVDGLLAAALLDAVSRQAAGAPVDVALAQVLSVSGTTPTPRSAPIECFVGPPGDGKTTTVVKLASHAQRAGARVALVSTDTYRVGAAMELEVYGRALGVATARATSPGELAAALARFAGYDRILIDTAGVSPGETAARAELLQLLAVLGQGAACTVVASAACGAVAAARTWETFAAMGPAGGIVTKRDLAPGGPLLAQLWRAGVPVSHLTTGRRIPDDLEPATPARLAESLLAA